MEGTTGVVAMWEAWGPGSPEQPRCSRERRGAFLEKRVQTLRETPSQAERRASANKVKIRRGESSAPGESAVAQKEHQGAVTREQPLPAPVSAVTAETTSLCQCLCGVTPAPSPPTSQGTWLADVEAVESESCRRLPLPRPLIGPLLPPGEHLALPVWSDPHPRRGPAGEPALPPREPALPAV